jgi:hypothetical protein
LFSPRILILIHQQRIPFNNNNNNNNKSFIFSSQYRKKIQKLSATVLKLTVLVPINCERLVPEVGFEETCNTGHQASKCGHLELGANKIYLLIGT